MKLHYDRETDSLYIELSGEPGVDSNEISDGGVADFDVSGNLGRNDRGVSVESGPLTRRRNRRPALSYARSRPP
jgi:hypothetical protein